MFGYIRPCKAELRVKELEAFRSVYCGLCKQLGRSFGALARLTLSYDFVFLAMLAYAASDTKPDITRARCAVNPLLGISVCKGDEILGFCADTAALMIYYNLRDKIDDSKFPAKTGYSILLPFAAHARKKAARRIPETEETVARLYKQQRKAEASGTAGIDAAAQPTANALAAISAGLSSDPGQQRVLERLGYMLGRYVYIADALDDLESDLKTGSFNPLAQIPQARERAKETLMMTAGEAGLACGLLKLPVFEPVIHNIVYLGLAEQAQRIYDKEKRGGKI